MPTIPFQKVQKYNDLVFKFGKLNKDKVHLGVIASSYFRFAELQIRAFESNIGRYFAPENQVGHIDTCYSTAFSFYTLIRTCLEANRKFSDEIQMLDKTGRIEKYRTENASSIKDVITVANDIVKHPLEDSTRSKISFFEPTGLSISGDIDIHEWSTDGYRSVRIVEINPVDDCDRVFNYLEQLADISLDVFKDDFSKWFPLGSSICNIREKDGLMEADVMVPDTDVAGAVLRPLA